MTSICYINIGKSVCGHIPDEFSKWWMSADIVSYLREADMRYHMCRQRDFRHVCHLKTGGAYV